MRRDGKADRSGCAGAAPDPVLLRRGIERRVLVAAAVASGIVGALPRAARAEGAQGRPQKGDHFAFFAGDKAGTEIKPEDLVAGKPQIIAWPVDPASGAPRDDSRLNQVILIRLDPSSLDEPTKARAADGIVAYSAICTHAQCPVAGWKPDKHVFHCNCHNSEYDPGHGAKVVFGPAPRALAALPLKIENGALVADGPFIGRVGLRPT